MMFLRRRGQRIWSNEALSVSAGIAGCRGSRQSAAATTEASAAAIWDGYVAKLDDISPTGLYLKFGHLGPHSGLLLFWATFHMSMATFL